MKKILLLLLVSTLLTNNSQADLVHLKDGSIINGTIKNIYKKKMKVLTKFAGEINIDISQITEFKTDKEVNIEITKGVKKTVSNSIDLVPSKITMLWCNGENPPNYKAPFKKSWKHSVSAGIVIETGNSDEKNFNLNALSTLAGENDTLKFFAKYKNTESNGVKTTEKITLGTDYERNLQKNSSWYLRANGTKDKFNDLKLRLTAATGYGYYFIKKENLSLRGRVGLFHRYTTYESNRSASNSTGSDLGIRLDYKMNDSWAWYTDISYMPSFEDFTNYIITHESALVIPLNNTHLEFKIGVRNVYDSNASDDKENMDTTYFSNLQLNF